MDQGNNETNGIENPFGNNAGNSLAGSMDSMAGEGGDVNPFAGEQPSQTSKFRLAGENNAGQSAGTSGYGAGGANPFGGTQPVNSFGDPQMGQPAISYGNPAQTLFAPPPDPSIGLAVKKEKNKRVLKRVALVFGILAALFLILFGIWYIPKLIKPDKERVQEALRESLLDFAQAGVLSDTVGLETISDAYRESGGNCSVSIVIDELPVSKEGDFSGTGVRFSATKDMQAKQLLLDAALTYSEKDVLAGQFYATEDTSSLLVPEVFEGFLSIANKNFLQNLMNSPLMKELDQTGVLSVYRSLPIFDLDFFSVEDRKSYEIPEEFDVWGMIKVKDRGFKKTQTCGESVSTRHYLLVWEEDDIEQFLTNCLNSAWDSLSTVAGSGLGGFGVDMSSMKKQITSLIASFINEDVTADVYLKGGKLVKLTCSGAPSFYGVSISYNLNLEIYDGKLLASASMGVQGASISISAEGERTASGSSLTLRTAGLPGENIEVKYNSSISGNVITGSLSMNGGSATNEPAVLDFEAELKDVTKDQRFTLDLKHFTLSVGENVGLKGHGSLSMDLGNKAVTPPQLSGKEYPVLSMTEEDFKEMTSSARVSDWLLRLKQDAPVYYDLFSGLLGDN